MYQDKSLHINTSNNNNDSIYCTTAWYRLLYEAIYMHYINYSPIIYLFETKYCYSHFIHEELTVALESLNQLPKCTPVKKLAQKYYNVAYLPPAFKFSILTL